MSEALSAGVAEGSWAKYLIALRGSRWRWLGRRGYRIDANEFPRTAFVFKLDHPINEREQRIVFAATDILARFPFGPALARKDISTKHALTAEFLQSQSLRV